VCAVITPTHVLCANVGDSRCVLSTEVQIISMSEDHKPSIVNEHDRITRAGGFVLCDRVNGEVHVCSDSDSDNDGAWMGCAGA